MSPSVTTIVFLFLALQLLLPRFLARILIWISPLISWGAVAYVLGHAKVSASDALPMIALFFVWLAETLERKKIEPLITYSTVLLSMAFFTNDAVACIIQLVIADALVAADVHNNQSPQDRVPVARSFVGIVFSLLPALTAALLTSDPLGLRVGFFITIALRLLYWPFTHWSAVIPKTTGRNYFVVCSGGIFCFALWKCLGPAEGVWALILLSASALSSVGGRAWSVAILTGLALFSLKEPWVVFVPAIWPLLWRGGRNRVLLVMITGLFAAVAVPAAVAGWDEAAQYAAAALYMLLAGRAFGAFLVKQASIWWELITIFMSLLLLAIPFMDRVQWDWPRSPLGITAGAGLVGVAFLGWIFRKYLERVYRPLPSFPLFQGMRAGFDKLARERGPNVKTRLVIEESIAFDRFLDLLESEFAVAAFGLGGFAAWLLWSTR